MGSGAFLVAACRILADAYEAALVRAGGCHPSDIGDAERAAIRRTIAERCLYGVDLNPMAVQLARLSLWLATLAADRPLSFLDHRLQVGDSLLGAWLAHAAASAGTRRRRRARPQRLPLFDDDDDVATRCARRCRSASRSSRCRTTRWSRSARRSGRSRADRARRRAVAMEAGRRPLVRALVCRPTATPRRRRRSARCPTRSSPGAARCPAEPPARYLERGRAIGEARRLLSLGARVPGGVLRSRRRAPAGRRLRRRDRQSAVGHDPRRRRRGRRARRARAPTWRRSLRFTRDAGRLHARSRTGTRTAISCSSSARSR